MASFHLQPSPFTIIWILRIDRNRPMEWLAAPLGFARYLLTAFVMYGCFLLVERLCPVEPHQPWRHLRFNLVWYIVYSLISVSLQATGIGLFVTVIQGWLGAPFIHLPIPQDPLAYGLMALLYFLVTDFFYYWFHRWQHTTAFLWEQHKLHHSEVSLNVTSTRRVHWLEDPLLLLFLGLPMGLLFQFNGLAMGILAFVQILWLQFIHMNLRLELGWLSPIVTGPQYHRIHHSFQDAHLDKNFAAFFPIWDIVFGTYHHPLQGEFPATGLASGETYDNLWLATILPFREWLGPNYLGRFSQRKMNTRDLRK
ncbi:MAG: sterol desaturase family protein [Synechococcales bacterium]|nr:sterol desaturase family protein [Synechococcales bacterium]